MCGRGSHLSTFSILKCVYVVVLLSFQMKISMTYIYISINIYMKITLVSNSRFDYDFC